MQRRLVFVVIANTSQPSLHLCFKLIITNGICFYSAVAPPENLSATLAEAGETLA